MDTPLGRKQITHDRIVETAARALRRGGFSGIAVAEVMREAGLTHGGFYAHFASRDALLREAVERAGRDSAARIAKSCGLRQSRGVSPFRAFVEHYLSDQHLAEPEHGCPVAALVAEAPRQAADVAEAAAQGVRSLVAAVKATLPPGAAPADAPSVAAQLVGALQLARALGHNAEGHALLAATRRALIARHDPTSG